MTEQLRWSMSVQAIHGPQITRSGSLDVEAYDKIDVVVAPNATVQVDLGSAGSTRVDCIVINPAVLDRRLTYDVGGTAVSLDAPHVLVGGAAALARSTGALSFTNGTTADAPIEILVGRDATP